MKGIILAGGSGTRLYPLTKAVSKQLMPVYDKPMIYYPLSTLMQAGINEILIISTPNDLPKFKELLGDGRQLGCRFEYAVQDKPRGLADAFIVGEKFIGKDKVAMILGDNIFWGQSFTQSLTKAASLDEVAMILGDNIFYGASFERYLKNNTDPDGGIIYAYKVSDPERYGIVEFDDNNNAVSIEEKPIHPKSSYAIPGLYFFDNDVVKIAKEVKPSARGEIEITSIHEEYLKMKKLKVKKIDGGVAWLDTGTFDSMMKASQFVQVVQDRQGVMVGCIEEVAYKMGFIDKKQINKLAEGLLKSGYGKYLLELQK